MMTIKDQIEKAKAEEFLTADQLALLLQYGRVTIYRRARAGKIPGAIREGRSWRFIRADVMVWVSKTLRYSPASLSQ